MTKLQTDLPDGLNYLFVYRQNSLYDRIAAEVKARCGKAHSIVIPAGTQSLTEEDREKLKSQLKSLMEDHQASVKVLSDSTLPRMLAIFHGYTAISAYINRLIPGGADSLEVVLKKVAERAKSYGAENIAVVLLGIEREDNKDLFGRGGDIDTHGICIRDKQGNEKEFYSYGGEIGMSTIEEIIMVYEFMKAALNTEGLKVFPAVYFDSIGIAGPLEECSFKIKFDRENETRSFVDFGKVAIIPRQTSAIIADRHIHYYHCLEREWGKVFHKHDNNIIEDCTTGETICPFEDDKKLIDAVVTEILAGTK